MEANGAANEPRRKTGKTTTKAHQEIRSSLDPNPYRVVE
jgi:hypothetical protein